MANLASQMVQWTKINLHRQLKELSLMSSKIRDEGVIPTVHAFNVLRAAFNDTNLATNTSGFSAEALVLSIRSFSSPYWDIRNMLVWLILPWFVA